MWSSSWKVIAGCFLLGAVLIVVVLVFFYKKRSYDGGFVRIYREELLEKRDIADIKFNSYYFAGISSGEIYLGSLTGPAKVLSVSASLRNQHMVRLPISKDRKLARSRLHVTIDTDYVAGWEDVTPALVYGTNISDSLQYYSLAPQHLFSTPVFLKSRSIIVKGYDSTLMKSVLKKIPIEKNMKVITGNVLEKQLDGYFCTDGFLVSDIKKLHLVYVYYYRNRMVCMDTSMVIHNQIRTIDTVSTAHIAVSTISSDNTQMLSSPPTIVNKRAFIHNDYILVQSAMRGGAEDFEIFDHSTVLDIYDILKGTYLFSITIPDYKENKVLDFAIYNDVLYVIQGNFLTSYEMKIR